MKKKLLIVLLVLALISLTINLFAKDIYSDLYRCCAYSGGVHYLQQNYWPYSDQCKDSSGDKCNGTEGTSVECSSPYTNCFCGWY